MQKSNTGVIILIVLAAAIAGYFGFKQFNKPAQAPSQPAVTQTAPPQPAASSEKPAASQSSSDQKKP